MKKHYLWVNKLLLATLFFYSCDQPTTQQSNTNLSIDNCSIALIPHQVIDQADIVDTEIIRRQIGLIRTVKISWPRWSALAGRM